MSRERVGQIIWGCVIVGVIYVGMCLPWWTIWIGNQLLILVVLVAILIVSCKGLGNLQDRIDGGVA